MSIILSECGNGKYNKADEWKIKLFYLSPQIKGYYSICAMYKLAAFYLKQAFNMYNLCLKQELCYFRSATQITDNLLKYKSQADIS